MTETSSSNLAVLLNVREAAKALAVSERTLWALTAPRGPIACVRIGAAVRYRPEALSAFAAARESQIDTNRGESDGGRA